MAACILCYACSALGRTYATRQQKRAFTQKVIAFFATVAGACPAVSYRCTQEQKLTLEKPNYRAEGIEMESPQQGICPLRGLAMYSPIAYKRVLANSFCPKKGN